ncbi:maleylpyruvate isomerase family mycothiol-dependent enzyme [Blastococcus sp. CT_GayMR16]|uniref:maleylpyruvate isomerase family mycothiol-dependent enzyme n=1 Tax=Blastococcus sp. CT_GayMR16 TaxID=2559607 RepID=UPI001073668A|nr:maleylpyruvate isomerase family mycothiol-dependent enzyme [Blastococcus sp. CT_GayMR16]TFV86998.1 maleylpyruvate isomerase family mycothiol-dependent enzyme [Blastococcus sp. CT_GayMR16]
MTALADRTIDADHSTYQRLSSLVGALTDDQLTQPSGASEWTVAQVLSHLGSGAEITLDTLRAARAGVERAGDANQAVWDRWNAMSPREQADGYVRAGGDLDQAYGELDAAQRSELRVPMAFLPEPAGIDLFTGMRLNEAALHAWDVEVAFDPAATIPDDVAAVLVEQYLGPLTFLLGFTAKTDRLSSRPVTLTLRATGPDRTLGLGLGEQAELSDAPGQSDGEVRLPTEALPRLLTGRLRASDDARIRVDGPVSLADLRQVFPGF